MKGLSDNLFANSTLTTNKYVQVAVYNLSDKLSCLLYSCAFPYEKLIANVHLFYATLVHFFKVQEKLFQNCDVQYFLAARLSSCTIVYCSLSSRKSDPELLLSKIRAFSGVQETPLSHRILIPGAEYWEAAR